MRFSIGTGGKTAQGLRRGELLAIDEKAQFMAEMVEFAGFVVKHRHIPAAIRDIFQAEVVPDAFSGNYCAVSFM